MNISGVLKDNIKVFLPIIGLVIVIVAFYMIDLNAPPITSLTPSAKNGKVATPETTLEKDVNYKAFVRTGFGDFTIELFQDDSPKNVNNFIVLSEKGFYNNLKFHRIIENFIIQTGDKLGDGTGDAGYTIDSEFSKNLKFDSYTVGMVNSSQFFITLSSGDFQSLDGQYTIMGQIIDGFNVVDKIGSVKTDSDYSPSQNIVIKKIDIIKERK